MSGLIAANTNNGLGIAGLCWNCQILAIKVLNEYGIGNTWFTTQGITYATEHGADVINLSLGSPGSDWALAEAINAAYAANIVVVASAGNDSSDSLHYPAAYDHVLSVAATNQTDGRLFNSNYGYWVDIAAPGYGLTTTDLGGGYNNTCCTSGATAITSGVVALVKSQNPAWTPDQVMSQLACSAVNIDAIEPAYAGLLGAGRVDAYNALTITAPASCGVVQGGYSIQNGLGDTDLSPGNSLALVLKAKTFAPQNNNVVATLSTSDPYVTLNTSAVNFGDLKFGTLVNGLDVVSLNVHDNAPPGHVITLDFTFQDSQANSYTDSLKLTIHPKRLAGWPQSINWGADSSPVLEDVSGDNIPEIFAATVEGGLYGWNSDGTDLPGWPKFGLGRIDPTPSIADVNRDGVPEVIVVSEGAGLAVYSISGDLLPGWPQVITENSCSSIWSSPVIGDINGDGNLDIVIANYKRQVFAFNYNGTLLPGWPQIVPGVGVTPALADLDED
jgi:hypothetical protein